MARNIISSGKMWHFSSRHSLITRTLARSLFTTKWSLPHFDHSVILQQLSSYHSSNRSMVTVTKTSVIEIDINTQQSPAKPKTDTPNQADNTVMITPSAVRQIQHLVNLKRPDRPDTVFLRVFVDSGGCSGFQYKFEMDFDDGGGIDVEQDVVITAQDANQQQPTPVRVVIDKASLDMIKGSTLDYTREMIKSSFVVLNNPQSEQACGCGSSFAIKSFKSNPAID